MLDYKCYFSNWKIPSESNFYKYNIKPSNTSLMIIHARKDICPYCSWKHIEEKVIF